jgi:hypothetical protein
MSGFESAAGTWDRRAPARLDPQVLPVMEIF